MTPPRLHRRSTPLRSNLPLFFAWPSRDPFLLSDVQPAAVPVKADIVPGPANGTRPTASTRAVDRPPDELASLLRKPFPDGE